MELLLHLDSQSSTPLYKQLYDGLRDGIITGRFKAGANLPGSRTLAGSLAISRITVTECYERLASEGYLKTRKRSGTFVCRRLPELSLYASAAAVEDASTPSSALPQFSRYGAAVNEPLRSPDPPGMIRLN